MKPNSIVRTDGSEYGLYSLNAVINMDKVKYTSSRKELKDIPIEKIAKAHLQRMVIPDSYRDLKGEEYTIMQRIMVYYRKNPIEQLRYNQREDLIPLMEKALPSMRKMIDKMNSSISDKKKIFLEKLMIELKQLNEFSMTQVWQIWNFWLLRFCYPHTDDIIVQYWQEKVKPAQGHYMYYRPFFLVGQLINIDSYKSILKLINEKGGY